LGFYLVVLPAPRAPPRPIGIGRALARVVATWLLWATIVLGLVDAILAATGDRRQSLHDMIAGTIVVRTRLSTGIA
jgi:uncharacterized RDD family membrane protein YckC